MRASKKPFAADIAGEPNEAEFYYEIFRYGATNFAWMKCKRKDYKLSDRYLPNAKMM